MFRWKWQLGIDQLNRRAIATLERLAERYEGKGRIPNLNEVEALLWRAERLASLRLGGFWPRERGLVLSSGIEGWTSHNLGWSFPCFEAVGLIRRMVNWPCGRIIDIGAGCGLWTRVLMREFGAERVVGLDPVPKGGSVIATTFEDWCEDSGGPGEADVLLASWLPCEGQPGDDLGLQVLDSMRSQTLVYVGSGPNGPVGTEDFYDRLGSQFEEYATEPLPRVSPSVFPRDFARVYRRKERGGAEGIG